MADGGILRSTFIVKHDGNIDFLINEKNLGVGTGQSFGFFTSG